MNLLFDIPTRASRELDNRLAKKSNTSAKRVTTTVRGGSDLLSRISQMKTMVESNLGEYKDEYIVIKDVDELHGYISKCIVNGVIAIDTETDGLDPMLNTIAGVCIYTPGVRGAYIPINHISYITNEKLPKQLSAEDVRRELERVKDANIDVIMFNANFDIRVLNNQVGVKLKCTWDCYIAARLLNENEGAGNNGLKKLHQKYVLRGDGDAFSYEALFRGIPFTEVPIDVGYLYAAHDPVITYELYEYQKPFLTPTSDECISRGLEDVARVFHEIEMPCVGVVTDMEDCGIELDLVYTEELSNKYNAMLEEKRQVFYDICKEYEQEIESYRLQHVGGKLENPVNISSPVQLSILLYDVLKYDAGVDKKTKKPIRGTGEAVLESLDKPICKAILEYRTVEKLVSTYIDKLPTCVNPNDGRIHCNFNQYGADTGRFSSSDPNLQNIPSRNHDIRKMFKASDGYVLMSSDYS